MAIAKEFLGVPTGIGSSEVNKGVYVWHEHGTWHVRVVGHGSGAPLLACYYRVEVSGGTIRGVSADHPSHPFEWDFHIAQVHAGDFFALAENGTYLNVICWVNSGADHLQFQASGDSLEFMFYGFNPGAETDIGQPMPEGAVRVGRKKLVKPDKFAVQL